MNTVLVVDDEVDIAEMLQAVLGLEGYRVLAAFDGAEGYRVAVAEKPDLIITDWRMPRMDGDELIARVRAVPGFEDTPILLMSANQLEHHEPYLRKPFEVDRLLELIRQLLA